LTIWLGQITKQQKQSWQANDFCYFRRN